MSKRLIQNRNKETYNAILNLKLFMKYI